MTALISAVLYWGGCIFWLSVAGVVVWVAASEWSSRQTNNRAAAKANLSLARRSR